MVIRAKVINAERKRAAFARLRPIARRYDEVRAIVSPSTPPGPRKPSPNTTGTAAQKLGDQLSGEARARPRVAASSVVSAYTEKDDSDDDPPSVVLGVG